MKGEQALATLLTHPAAFSMELPASAINKRIEISRDKIYLTGIHLNALELNSDLWVVTRDRDGGVIWTTEI